jgi:hypothetical protein
MAKSGRVQKRVLLTNVVLIKGKPASVKKYVEKILPEVSPLIRKRVVRKFTNNSLGSSLIGVSREGVIKLAAEEAKKERNQKE